MLASGVLLLLPEVLLGANTVAGQRIHQVTVTVELLSVLGGLVLGLSLTGVFLRARGRTRGALATATVLALAIGAGSFVLANLWPPPFVTAHAAAGVPTLNGLLNAVYVGMTIGSCAAVLRLVAHAVAQPVARRLRRARGPA